MWKHVAQSLQGPSHAAVGSACQDSYQLRLLGDEAEETIVACVADGAGSAKHSEIGSALVCQAITESATQYYVSNGNFGKVHLETIVAWCDSALETLRSVAELHGCALRDLATTLCTAILSPEGSIFFQIGDGAITVKNQGIYGVVFWPQSGEYANITNFLTSDTYQNHLEFQATKSKVSEIALFTDGIERLALNFESQTPHLPFFEPLFHAVRLSDNGDDLAADLKLFLQSDSVNNRSDDDKTLILATRLSGSPTTGASHAAD